MRLEWSAVALADLDRFAAFLHGRPPRLAAVVAQEILAKARILEESPELGHPLSADGRYRQLVLVVLRANMFFAIALTQTASSCCAYFTAGKGGRKRRT